MIILLCWFLAIISISAYALYLNNKMNIYSKNLDYRESYFNESVRMLKSQQKALEDNYHLQAAFFINKKAEIQAYYNTVLELEKETIMRNTRAQKNIEILQRQISRLKAELNNARQKAKRLAEKNKRLV